MAIHFLKTWREPYRATYQGAKVAEFRRDDRNPPFRVGDILVLLPYHPESRLGFSPGATSSAMATWRRWANSWKSSTTSRSRGATSVGSL
jgi:hypothetical protein